MARTDMSQVPNCSKTERLTLLSCGVLVAFVGESKAVALAIVSY